jgi:hypothetical protein
MRKSHSKEEHVKEDVKEILKRHGVWSFMPIGGAFTAVGIPDFIGCFHGRFIAVETKFGRNKLSAWQERVLGLIKEAGGIALVINETNLQDLENELSGIRDDIDAGNT